MEIPRSPVLSHTVETLQRRIQQGIYPGGRPLPSERQLSQELGVSRTLVRLAIAEVEQRGLIKRAAGCRPLVRADVVQSFTPRSLVRRNLALSVPIDPYMTATGLVANGVLQTIDHDAFRVVISGPAGRGRSAVIERERQALERIAKEDIDGLILWYFGGFTNLPALEALRAANISMVFVDRLPPEGFHADFVGVDDVHGAREAVNYLISLGHRRIALVTNNEQVSTVIGRTVGYRQALEEAGIPFRPEYVVGSMRRSRKKPMTDSTEAIVDHLLGLREVPTAIFAVCDPSARNIVEVLRQRGVCVPEDISVIGFGDESLGESRSFLSTVRVPWERIGEHAVKLLLRRIDSKSNEPYCHILLDTQLIVRGSTSECSARLHLPNPVIHDRAETISTSSTASASS